MPIAAAARPALIVGGAATILLSLMAAACTANVLPNEETESLDQSIVNGRAVTTARPAVGYLAGRDDELPSCTATLVDASYVVTAAHCVRGIRASMLVFGTGVFVTTGPSRWDITRCRSNPKYRDTDPGVAYDFAYCELAQPITSIAPLAFATTPAFNASYLAIGYGQTDADDEDSIGPRKQLVVHRIRPQDEPLLEGLEEMLATSSSAGATCYGDSGSPLLVIGANGVARVAGVLQSGVTYDGDPECSPNGIDVYAPVAKNLDFFATR